MMASVCTGVFLLAQANVIHQQKVTTHWQDITTLKNTFPQLTVVKNTRWLEQDNLITSGGISAGIDMSLHLVAKLHSNDLAEQTAKTNGVAPIAFIIGTTSIKSKKRRK